MVRFTGFKPNSRRRTGDRVSHLKIVVTCRGLSEINKKIKCIQGKKFLGLNLQLVKNQTLCCIGKKQWIGSLVCMLWQWKSWVCVWRVHHQKEPFPEINYFAITLGDLSLRKIITTLICLKSWLQSKFDAWLFFYIYFTLRNQSLFISLIFSKEEMRVARSHTL